METFTIKCTKRDRNDIYHLLYKSIMRFNYVQITSIALLICLGILFSIGEAIFDSESKHSLLFWGACVFYGATAIILIVHYTYIAIIKRSLSTVLPNEETIQISEQGILRHQGLLVKEHISEIYECNGFLIFQFKESKKKALLKLPHESDSFYECMTKYDFPSVSHLPNDTKDASHLLYVPKQNILKSTINFLTTLLLILLLLYIIFN